MLFLITYDQDFPFQRLKNALLIWIKIRPFRLNWFISDKIESNNLTFVIKVKLELVEPFIAYQPLSLVTQKDSPGFASIQTS
jgi:hypothetical protein